MLRNILNGFFTGDGGGVGATASIIVFVARRASDNPQCGYSKQ